MLQVSGHCHQLLEHACCVLEPTMKLAIDFWGFPKKVDPSVDSASGSGCFRGAASCVSRYSCEMRAYEYWTEHLRRTSQSWQPSFVLTVGCSVQVSFCPMHHKNLAVPVQQDILKPRRARRHQTLCSASCSLSKCAALWKRLDSILAMMVFSRLPNMNSTCACGTTCSIISSFYVPQRQHHESGPLCGAYMSRAHPAQAFGMPPIMLSMVQSPARCGMTHMPSMVLSHACHDMTQMQSLAGRRVCHAMKQMPSMALGRACHDMTHMPSLALSRL